MATGEKAPDAFRTIGELSADLGVAQHILRYWETKFPQLKPLQRAGNRRYYRPADVALAKRIHRLLNEEGYTVKGVQKLLRSKDAADGMEPPSAMKATPGAEVITRPVSATHGPVDIERLKSVRDQLAAALEH
ncbi:MAG TPA: MerR family transcriptional regulator [Sphingomicrobium sp.]|nr:MerR family transcriptional regulator [Sphingomicrobium sp.]